MAWSLVAHGGTPGSSTGGTTSTANTVGADLFVVVTGKLFVGDHTVAVTDSHGNTYTQLTPQGNSAASVRISYCVNPITGASTTWTVTVGGGIYASACAAAFSGAASSPFDKENGGPSIGGATTLATGSSGTPTVANSLAIAGLCMTDGSTTVAIGSGFTISDQEAWGAGNNEGSVLAYKFNVSAAENPTFTISGPPTDDSAAVIAIFSPSVSGAGQPTMRRVGLVFPASRINRNPKGVKYS